MSTKIPPEYVIVQKAAICLLETAPIVLAGRSQRLAFQALDADAHPKRLAQVLVACLRAYMDTTEAKTCGNGKTHL